MARITRHSDGGVLHSQIKLLFKSYFKNVIIVLLQVKMHFKIILIYIEY